MGRGRERVCAFARTHKTETLRHKHTYTQMCTYTNVHLHAYIHTHTHTHTHTERLILGHKRTKQTRSGRSTLTHAHRGSKDR